HLHSGSECERVHRTEPLRIAEGGELLLVELVDRLGQPLDQLLERHSRMLRAEPGARIGDTPSPTLRQPWTPAPRHDPTRVAVRVVDASSWSWLPRRWSCSSRGSVLQAARAATSRVPTAPPRRSPRRKSTFRSVRCRPTAPARP